MKFNWNGRNRLFFGIVVFPVVVALIYYAFFALDRYVSTAQVAIRQAGASDAPQMPGLAVMLGGINTASREETLYVREFVTSSDMLDILQARLAWSEHYSGRLRDPLYYLKAGDSREGVLAYYRRLVTANFDDQTGLLKIEVQAFDRVFAEQVLKLVLSESERFVNEISHKMAREQMKFAETELASARRHYEHRRELMLEFQAKNQVLDAQASAEAKATVIAEIEGELTRARATLKSMQSSWGPGSPQIRQQKNLIEALSRQIKAESNSLVAGGESGNLSAIAAQYRNLTIDTSIAEESYKYAVSAVETARIEASKKIRSLITVVSPNQPDESVYPQRLYNLITMAIVLLLLFGIVSFIVATIEDHKD